MQNKDLLKEAVENILKAEYDWTDEVVVQRIVNNGDGIKATYRAGACDYDPRSQELAWEEIFSPQALEF